MAKVHSRRAFLAGAGALVVSWRLASVHPALATTGNSPALPGDLTQAPWLDACVRIDAIGKVTLFTGKGELRHGVKTALLKIPGEELKVPLSALQIVTADTSSTPNAGYIAASHSMSDSGTAIRHVAAQGRDLLRAEAAHRWGVDIGTFPARNATVTGPKGETIGYGDPDSDTFLHVKATPDSTLTHPSDFTLMYTPVARVDTQAKATGGAAYIQDLRPDGMLHARVIRPPSLGATLSSLHPASVMAMNGGEQVVRNGNFLAVVAKKEWTVIRAMRRLSDLVVWNEVQTLPSGNPPVFLAVTHKCVEATLRRGLLRRGRPGGRNPAM